VAPRLAPPRPTTVSRRAMQHMPVQARGWAPPQRLVTTGLAEGAVPSGHASATRVSRRGAAAASFAAMVFAGSPLAAHATSVFTGVYDDPNHPGCPRTIDESGKIVGVDPVPFKRGSGCGQDTKLSPPWSIQGKVRWPPLSEGSLLLRGLVLPYYAGSATFKPGAYSDWAFRA